jgi:hypothetical protein
MTTKQLEKELFKQLEKLPKEALKEVLEFVKILRKKGVTVSGDHIKSELSLLNDTQLAHLEKEFEGYEELYPRE